MEKTDAPTLAVVGANQSAEKTLAISHLARKRCKIGMTRIFLPDENALKAESFYTELMRIDIIIIVVNGKNQMGKTIPERLLKNNFNGKILIVDEEVLQYAVENLANLISKTMEVIKNKKAMDHPKTKNICE